MAFKLTEADHRTLDAHLNMVLEAYKNGTISLLQARGSLAHLITAGVKDNEGEFKSYIKLRREDIFEDE
jgi:hypothetical protein